jgi:cobalt-zinc-cadmium efflux system membrane fusion protein
LETVVKSIYILVLPLLTLQLAACNRAPAQDATAQPAWSVDGDSIRLTGRRQLEGVRIGSATAVQVGHAQVSGRLLWTEETTARVFTPFNGRIEKILANPGEKVARNQPLLQLSSSDYGQAQAEASKADTDLGVAHRQFNRAQELLDAGVLARKDYEQTEADLHHAEAEAARTHSRLRALGEHRDSVDGSFVLRSPIAGVIVARAVNVGTEVRADAPNPLFVVTDPSRMTLLLDLPESLSGALVVGEDVRFTASSEPDHAATARITHVAAEVDPLTQTVKARGVVLNENRALRGESFVEALVPLAGPASNAVRVPADALILVGNQHYLFAPEGASYRRVPVHVGALGTDGVEITGGVKAGAPIVVDGALYLEQLLESAGHA